MTPLWECISDLEKGFYTRPWNRKGWVNRFGRGTGRRNRKTLGVTTRVSLRFPYYLPPHPPRSIHLKQQIYKPVFPFSVYVSSYSSFLTCPTLDHVLSKDLQKLGQVNRKERRNIRSLIDTLNDPYIIEFYFSSISLIDTRTETVLFYKMLRSWSLSLNESPIFRSCPTKDTGESTPRPPRMRLL